jgi:hypothetical protein
MDPNRFDALSRRTATATTRRDAIRGLAGGGLLAVLGLKAAATAPEAAAATTCTMTWTGNVRLGPDTGVMLVAGATQPGELKGTLTLPIGDDGAIAQGQLALPDGTTMTVVGQATGRALNLRLTDGSGRMLVAVGTGEQPITACAGMVDGSLTGPQLGDLGEWHAVASGATGTTTGASGGVATGNPAGATTNPGATSTSTAGGGGTTTDTSGGGGQTACASGVVCNGVCCEGAPGLTPDSITCNGGFCECTYSCQAAGCGGGDGTIVNTCGSDPQPHCHSECNVPADNGCGDMTCGDGQTLDVDTCTCVDNGGGGAADCGGADLLHDANNCGFCGQVCGSGFCQNGVCAPSDPCPQEGLTNCNSLCVDTQNDPENCGGCGNHCPSGQCIEGGCTDPVH